MRFNIGDKLAYPFYGAGVVEDIIHSEVLGEVKEYYVISFSGNRVKVNVPTDKAAENGLRCLISPEKLPEVYEHFNVPVDVKGETWSKRSKVSMDKLRGGDILETVEVYKYLKENPIIGIPQIIELYEENNILTLIEEYVPGTTLK